MERFFLFSAASHLSAIAASVAEPQQSRSTRMHSETSEVAEPGMRFFGNWWSGIRHWSGGMMGAHAVTPKR